MKELGACLPPWSDAGSEARWPCVFGWLGLGSSADVAVKQDAAAAVVVKPDAAAAADGEPGLQMLP